MVGLCWSMAINIQTRNQHKPTINQHEREKNMGAALLSDVNLTSSEASET
jgi:hypothetical protein